MLCNSVWTAERRIVSQNQPHLCDHKAICANKLEGDLVCQDAGVAMRYVGNCSSMYVSGWGWMLLAS